MSKWNTLRHEGVQFPPSYEPLPPGVQIKYDGKSVKLDSKSINNKFNISAEEGAVFFARELEKDDRLSGKNKKRKKTVDSVFKKNFWNDWKETLGKNSIIKDFSKVDFSNIQKYIVKRSEEKKAERKKLSKEEKKKEKEEKEEKKKKYGYAEVDGKRIALGNYVIQPPGLYLGHGEHPLRGKIKKRITPGDITINISGKSPPCKNPDGTTCKWGNVIENKDVTWIASYIQPVNNDNVYVYLSRQESHFVTESDKVKFDKASALKKNIKEIRKKYELDLKSDNDEKRQLATAVFLLDKLAVRPGTEKDEKKESNTLGLTTLKCDNVTFYQNNEIKINFVGKSSIPFEKKFKVLETVYKNLKKLCSGTTKKLFPKINANSLNGYLKTLLPGLTAKNFRTWKASTILQEMLENSLPDIYLPIHEKKILYDNANVKVALALNHKRLLDSDEKVEKLKSKLEELEKKKKEATTDKKKASVEKSIKLAKSKLEEAEENVATTTSKINYLDPRITVAWCKKAEMPIEKIYNKATLKKFKWSMSIKPDWEF